MGTKTETSFLSLGLTDWLVGQLNAVGIKDPTSVQANCIPPILEGQLNPGESTLYLSLLASQLTPATVLYLLSYKP